MAFFDRIGYRGLEGCGLLFWRESSLPSSTPAPQSPFFVLATDRVGIERLTGASLVRGAQTYANPATRPTLRQAASVLPESGRSRLRVRIRNCWSARAFAEVGRAWSPEFNACSKSLWRSPGDAAEFTCCPDVVSTATF